MQNSRNLNTKTSQYEDPSTIKNLSITVMVEEDKQRSIENIKLQSEETSTFFILLFLLNIKIPTQ